MRSSGQRPRGEGGGGALGGKVRADEAAGPKSQGGDKRGVFREQEEVQEVGRHGLGVRGERRGG